MPTSSPAPSAWYTRASSGCTSPYEARIEVIESFKGSGERLEAQRGSDASCGFSFTPGEERVYFVFSGAVNLCGRAAPSAELLERLRKLKVADAGCEGIVHPPRPPAVFAVEEADPSPYEPLYGYDPDLALGVGHVRPVREEERDDWPRRLKLPVFTAPGGEVKIWLTPGSVGGDVLVETGYETASLIVLQARPDGWLQIRFGGPLASGAGWVHRCHLDAATPRLEYEPWEKLLAGAVPLYFRAWSPRVLRKAPSHEAPRHRQHSGRPEPLRHPAAPVPRRLGARAGLDSFQPLRRPQAHALQGVRRLGALARRQARPRALVLHPRLLIRIAVRPQFRDGLSGHPRPGTTSFEKAASRGRYFMPQSGATTRRSAGTCFRPARMRSATARASRPASCRDRSRRA